MNAAKKPSFLQRAFARNSGLDSSADKTGNMIRHFLVEAYLPDTAVKANDEVKDEMSQVVSYA